MRFNTEFYTHIDVKEFSGHKDEVNCVAFSSDFEILVTGSDDERTRIFNTNTGKLVVTLKGQNGAIRAVAVSPDSKYIASGSYDKTTALYKTSSAETLHILKGHLKSVESVNFSPCSSKLCTTSWDRTGILWEVETGFMLKIFQGHSGLVQCSAFSPCNRMLATGSWDHTVRVWPLGRHACGHIQELKAHKSNVHALAFSKHNILATGGWDKQVFLWNPYTGELLCVLSGHEGWVQAVCFSDDGMFCVSTADDEMVKIWSTASGDCLKTLEGRTDTASHCGFHPSGALVASGAAVTTLVLPKKDDFGTEGSGEPPHVLNGEEILNHIDTAKQRAHSAKPNRDGITSSESQKLTNTHKPRPQTAVVCKVKRPESVSPVSNVQSWLASSFQTL